MSRSGFWIRRNDHLFEAKSWDMICHWTKEGRVKLSDSYRTPHTQEWLEVRRDPTLSGLIPKSERLIIKRDGVEYRAPSFEAIRIWAQRGQVSPNDQIYSSYTRLWALVSDIPSIMEHIPTQLTEVSPQISRSQNDGAAIGGV